MKTKFLNLTGTVVFLSFIFYGCGFKLDNPTLLNETICSNYSTEPISQLPVALVHDMADGYRKNQLTEIQRGVTKGGVNLVDAQSIWFDLETLKKFIYHVENETVKKDKNISIKELGIRIYYASYPSQETIKGQNLTSGWNKVEYNGVLSKFNNTTETEQYGRMHTLFMIPTRIEEKEGKVENVDFNPLDIQTFTTRLTELNDKYSNNPQPILNDTLYPSILSIGGPVGSFKNTQGSSFSNFAATSAQNHGQLYPPYSGGNAF